MKFARMPGGTRLIEAAEVWNRHMHIRTRFVQGIDQQGVHIREPAGLHARCLFAILRKKAALAQLGSYQQDPGPATAFDKGWQLACVPSNRAVFQGG
jgi:hypothetical protein